MMTHNNHYFENPYASVSAYKLAVEDEEFLRREEMRSLRFSMEFSKADLILNDHKIKSTLTIFGSARFVPADVAFKRYDDAVKQGVSAEQLENLNILKKTSRYYETAREFARIVSEKGGSKRPYGPLSNVVATGGGPGIMEAGNRGAFENGAPTIGFNIKLPFEQAPNPYITPSLCMNFHYFMIRKMHLVMRSNALAVFPGGFGTLDEMFEAATLVQTHKSQPIRIIAFGKEYWEELLDLSVMVKHGVISKSDLDLITFVDDPEEGWAELIKKGLPME